MQLLVYLHFSWLLSFLYKFSLNIALGIYFIPLDNFTNLDSPLVELTVTYPFTPFFLLVKYFTNRKNGVKGYVTVNSTNGESKLVKLSKGMKYMPSAMFNENLYRKESSQEKCK